MRETNFKHTDIGPIPNDWELTPLNELFEFGNGYTPSTENPKFWSNKGLPWFRMEDIRKNGRILSDSILHITPEAVKSSGLFPAGSFILSTTATIGEHAWLIADSLANQQFTFLKKGKSLKDIDSLYFFYKLFEIGEWCRNNVSKSTLMSVNMAGLKSYLVSHPIDREEQHRIGTALSDIDELIDSLRKLIDKKRNIKQGAMSCLLTGKRRLPGFTRPWVTNTLSSLGAFIKGKGISKAEVGTGSIPAVRYGEIYTDHSDYIKEFRSYISDDVARRSQLLRYGDICFAASGETLEEIGKAVAFINVTEAYAGGDIIIFRPEKDINPIFFGFILNSPRANRQKSLKGHGLSIMHIRAAALSEIEVEYPVDIKEQEAIAKVLTDMDDEIESLEKKLAKYEQVKQGMMTELLTGKIRLI